MKVTFLGIKAPSLELRDQMDHMYRKVMAAGWFIMGPEVEAFEEYGFWQALRH